MSVNYVLVTGAAGFVGGYVVRALREGGRRVLGMVRRPEQAARIRSLGAEPVLATVMDSASLARAMVDVDGVIHLAAVNRDRAGATMDAVNYRGTVNVLGAAKAAGVKRLVQVIGIGADSRRSSPLSRSQGLAAEAVMGARLPATVLEAGVIFEHGDAFTTMLTGLARIAPVVVVPGDGKARFEPISARDVAAAAVNALTMPEVAGKRLEIVGPEVLTLDQVYDQLLQTIGVKRLKLHLPVALLRPVVHLMSRFLPEPPVTTALLDLLELDILAKENASETLIGRPPLRFAENLDHLHQVTAGRFLAIIFGRQDRREGESRSADPA
jgi:NADH dehydrogenase